MKIDYSIHFALLIFLFSYHTNTIEWHVKWFEALDYFFGTVGIYVYWPLC